ncbi:MAG: DUF4012 domain-containing protein [Actinomycetota bacterium]
MERALLWALVVGAGVGTTFADAMPTGIEWWDRLLLAALGVCTAAAASKAPRAALIVFAVVLAAASGATVWAFAAWGGLLLVVSTVSLDRRDRLANAAAGALLVQSLVRLPAFGFFGLPSLIAGIALLGIWTAGYQYAGRRVRRTIRFVTAGLVVATGVALLFGFFAVMSARSDVDLGVNAARRGLEAARAGDSELVTIEVERAEAALQSAEAELSGWSALGLRYVPVVAQNHDVVLSASREGTAVADQAVAAIAATELSELTLQAGAIDLDAISDAAPQLVGVVDTLEGALAELQVDRSPWVLPVVNDRITELTAEIADFLPDARLAAEAATFVPGLAGGDGARHYFVIFGTPGESRELGGFMGSWAFVRFDDGVPSLVDSGRYQKLLEVAASSGFDESSVSSWYREMGRVTRFPQNVTSSPDIGVVAEVTRALFADAFDEPIDGVLYLDQWALIDLLDIAGEITIPGRAEPVTPANAEDYFFREQYEFVGADRTELFDQLALGASSILTELEGQDLPGPEELGRLLGPAARAGRLQVVTFDDAENAFLESVKLQRSFVLAGTTSTDLLAVVQANATASKLDIYLDRSVDYSVTRADDGSVTARATIELASTVPANAPAYATGPRFEGATNQVLLSLYSPFTVETVIVNGIAVDATSAVEYGKWRHLVSVPVPPDGASQMIVFELEGFIDPSRPYSLEVWHQPLVNDDVVSVSYDGRDGTISWSATVVENQRVSVSS